MNRAANRVFVIGVGMTKVEEFLFCDEKLYILNDFSLKNQVDEMTSIILIWLRNRLQMLLKMLEYHTKILNKLLLAMFTVE